MLRVGYHFLTYAVLAMPVLAGDPRSAQDLHPRPLQFPSRAMTVSEVLKHLQVETENSVVDKRKIKSDDPKLTLTTKSFWESLDALGEATKIGFSAYQEEGGVALIDGPYRKLTTHYSGLFRFALKRTSINRDDETQTHFVQLTLDAAWEPRLQPLYLNLESASATVGKRTEKIDRQAMRSVAGTGATEFEVRLPAPPRAVMQIDSLKGELRVIGAPKMLDFTFEKIKDNDARSAKREGVEVEVGVLKKTATRWSLLLTIKNPRGAIAPLESFQSWLDNNRLTLTWIDPQSKKVKTLEPINEVQEGDGETMKIHFDFTARPDTPLPPRSADVTLRYRTPNRVVAFTVPFAFENLPLP